MFANKFVPWAAKAISNLAILSYADFARQAWALGKYVVRSKKVFTIVKLGNVVKNKS